ncbi:MAG TPA: pyridoxal-phosphate dependent enzyme [Polyangia bacterium]|jgi:threonine dehydratase
MAGEDSFARGDDTGPVDVVDLDAVAFLIRPHLRPTTFIESEGLDEAVGAPVRIASETFQHTGSFKFRAGLAAALHAQAEHLITASSGNFGAALALAARRAGKRCTVVMPAQSSEVKIAAVRRHGATVELIDTTQISRAARVEELKRAMPEAHAVSAYDDPYVIAGNATLGAEIFAAGATDVVVVPVGGGGLSSGIVAARNRAARGCKVVGAEPLLANDAARSLRAGVLCKNDGEPATLCDGARASLGQRNFAILRRGIEDIVEVTEENVVRALRLLYDRANLKVEPTGALAVAAVLQEPARFAGARVTCVVSGGNVDATLYARLLAGS